MRRTFTAILVWSVAYASTLQAGGGLDLIFTSSFEGPEACVVFDGSNDMLLVRAVNISGNFTLNGETFPLSEYDDANFSLRNSSTGDYFYIGNSHDVSYSVNVIPGRYDVMYSVETRGDNAPHNVGAVVMENVLLFSDQTLDIDVTAYRISGTFSLNGEAFPADEYDDGNFHLDSEQSGQLFIGNSHDQTFAQMPVLGGDYEIRWAKETSGAVVPLNEWGYVGPLSVTANHNALEFDVQSVEVDGDFSHNGAPFPQSEFDDANFFLETESGDRVFLGNSHDGGYVRNAIPGTYDLFFEPETYGATMPFNTRARVGTGVDISLGKLDIDVDSYQVSGNFTLNGGAFPVSAADTGRIVLHDELARVNNVLGFTNDGSYDYRIVRGLYRVVYQHWQGTAVPQNRQATVIEGVIVKSAATMDVNVLSRLFSASVYHNNALFPADPGQNANILLLDQNSNDALTFGKTSEQHLSARVIPGTYDAYYSHQNGNQVPQNKLALIMEGLEISPVGPVLNGGGGIQFDVDSRVISGTMTLNDAPFPLSEYDDGVLQIGRAADSVVLGNTHDQTYQVRIIDDPSVVEYWIQYSVQTTGDNVPVNSFARVQCMLLEPAIILLQ